MTKEELEKEAEDYAEENKEVDWEGFDKNKEELKQAYLASAEPREKRIEELKTTNKRISDECHKLVDTLEKKQKEVAEFEAQLTIKIINCIKSHLCKQDEDYDKPIISPKFLSDTLDQMVIDGFEGEIKENEYR